VTDYAVGPLPLRTKVGLAVRAWYWFMAVHLLVRTRSLPRVVEQLRAASDRRGPRVQPARLGTIVGRALRLRRKQARCLIGSLVLYRLLSEQGTPAELVIGLPTEAKDHRAHAWIEVDGWDVGPPPGSKGHAAIARYA
jgi:hypothetical protein